MKGGQTDHPPEKTTFKKPTLITVNKYLNWSYLKEKRKKNILNLLHKYYYSSNHVI